MNRRLLFLVVITAIVTLLVSACAQSTSPAPAQKPAPAPAASSSAPAPAPAPAKSSSAPALASPSASPKTSAPQAAGAINLRFAYHTSMTSPLSQLVHVPWTTETVPKATNNRVAITSFPSETLCKSAEQFDSVVQGIADLTQSAQSFNPGRFPLSELICLPFTGITNAYHGSRVLYELYSTTPELQKEFQAVKLLNIGIGDLYILVSKKPVHSLKDFQGMKIRSSNAVGTKALQAMGATPLTIPGAELYGSLEKGVVDAAIIDWNGVGSFKLNEVANYFVQLNFMTNPNYWAMNLNKWNSLPADVQKQMETVTGPYLNELHSKGYDAVGAQMQAQVKKMPGKEIITLPDEEMTKFVSTCESVRTEQVKALEAKGLPAKAIYDKMMVLIKKYAPASK